MSCAAIRKEALHKLVVKPVINSWGQQNNLRKKETDIVPQEKFLLLMMIAKFDPYNNDISFTFGFFLDHYLCGVLIPSDKPLDIHSCDYDTVYISFF